MLDFVGNPPGVDVVGPGAVFLAFEMRGAGGEMRIECRTIATVTLIALYGLCPMEISVGYSPASAIAQPHAVQPSAP